MADLGAFNDPAADGVEDYGAGVVANVKGNILSKVNDKAKSAVSASFDYTLLLGLFVMQYFRCQPQYSDAIQNVLENPLNSTEAKDNLLQAMSVSCDQLDFESNEYLLWGLIVTACCFVYGIGSSMLVWFHSSRNNDLPNSEVVEGIYAFTDRFVIVDSLLEIPISFFWCPRITIILWAVWTGVAIAIYCAVNNFFAKNSNDNTIVTDDTLNALVFTGCMLVYSFYKLTGELSQYWVFATSAASANAKQKLEEFNKRSSMLSRKSMAKIGNILSFGSQDVKEDKVKKGKKDKKEKDFNDEEHGKKKRFGFLG